VPAAEVADPAQACASIGALSGSAPLCDSGAAPWVCRSCDRPRITRQFSSSFIACGEGDTNVLGGRDVIATRIRPFGSRRSGHVGGAIADSIAVPREAFVGGQPGGLAAPVDVVCPVPRHPGARAETNVRKPIDSSATFPVRIIRSAHEIAWPYFCLIGQSRSARLVDVDVVGPAVEGRSAAARAAAAAAIGACDRCLRRCQDMRDELRTVVSEVGRPPILRIGPSASAGPLQRRVSSS